MYLKLFMTQVRNLKEYKSYYYLCYTRWLFTLAAWFSSTSPGSTTTARCPDTNTTDLRTKEDTGYTAPRRLTRADSRSHQAPHRQTRKVPL